MAALGSGADSESNQLRLRRWGHLVWVEPIITPPSAATRRAVPLRRLQDVAVEGTDTSGDRSFGLQNPDFNIVFASQFTQIFVYRCERFLLTVALYVIV